LRKELVFNVKNEKILKKSNMLFTKVFKNKHLTINIYFLDLSYVIEKIDKCVKESSC